MDKFVNLKKIFCICLLIVCVFMCSCAPKDDTHSENEPLTQEQIEFNSTLDIINQLEILSNQYNSQNSTLRALIYVRSDRYNSSQWQMVGGQKDENFETYILQNQTKDVSGLKNLANFVWPKTKEKVDFVHMFATLNVLFNSSNSAQHDLVGWGGDICQLAVDIKNSKKIGEELKDYATLLFNSSTGGFNSEDVCADLDAVNISILLKHNTTITESLKKYSKEVTVQERKIDYMQNIFGKQYNSAENLKQDIFNRISSNLYLNIWGQQNGLDFTADAEIIKICCDVFADYLVN